MKVVKLQAENLKRLVAVEITPDGALVQITGKNGAGKSSVLDSIWYALGGERAIPGEPVRKGAKAAKVTLDLGELIVERRWTEKGTYLFVSNKDGARYPNPQKVLDNLLGTLTFDPLAFARLEGEKQAKTLGKLVGLDTADLESKRAALYETRRDWNRDVKRLETEVAAGEIGNDEPPRPDLETLEAQAATYQARASHIANLQAEAKAAARAANDGATAAANADAQVQAAQEALKAAQAAAQRAHEDLRRRHDDVQNFKKLIEAAGEPPDVEAGNAALRAAREAAARHAAWVQQQQQLEEKKKQLMAAEKKADELTDEIRALDEEHARRLAACKMPLEGLSIDGATVRFNGIPFNQCSSAEQLRISTAIAMRLNPKLRVLRIADGSLLDSGNLAMLGDLAAEADYQIWIERVDESGDVGIVIEDGYVQGASTGEAAA